jgi:hypothetical protein
MISEQLVIKVQKLIKIHYGEDISLEKARTIAEGIVPFLRHNIRAVLDNK